MKTRTTSSRNIWGGFWGGVLGILATAVFPILTPIGCLLGVLIGFYYQEMLAGLVADYHKSVAGWKAGRDAVIAYLIASRKEVGEKYEALEKWLGEGSETVVAGIKLVGGAIRLLVAAVRWPSQHPMNGARTMTVMAWFTYAMVQFLWIGPLLWSAIDPSSNPMLLVGWLLASVLSLVVPAFVCNISDLEGLDEMRAYYTVYERYTTKGGLRFYARAVVKMFLAQILVAVSMLIIFGIGLICLALSLSLAIIPISLFLLSVKALYGFAKSRSHWPCYIVTCVVTITTAILLSSMIKNGTMMWLVALGNGALCAIMSEALRRALDSYFKRSQKAMKVAMAGWTWLEKPGARFFEPIEWIESRMMPPVLKMLA